ncbi:MAG: GAF domain-containing protein [Gemmatimonadetes bacterium]|nr:GAF domain-containing protein [Gemmatimonadota bacterium]
MPPRELEVAREVRQACLAARGALEAFRLALARVAPLVDASFASEVEDIFRDPGLHEWWVPARELGFVSLVAAPLVGRDGAKGALSFYYGAARRLNAGERQLVRYVAGQLWAVAGSRPSGD